MLSTQTLKKKDVPHKIERGTPATYKRACVHTHSLGNTKYDGYYHNQQNRNAIL
jgi:hypothetical protein